MKDKAISENDFKSTPEAWPGVNKSLQNAVKRRAGKKGIEDPNLVLVDLEGFDPKKLDFSTLKVDAKILQDAITLRPKNLQKAIMLWQKSVKNNDLENTYEEILGLFEEMHLTEGSSQLRGGGLLPLLLLVVVVAAGCSDCEHTKHHKRQ